MKHLLFRIGSSTGLSWGALLISGLAVVSLSIIVAASAFATVISEFESAEDRFVRAKELLGRGELEDARALLESWLTEEPGADSARLLLGTLVLDEDPADARAQAMTVLDSGRQNVGALNLLTAAYERARADGLDRETEARLRALEISDYRQLLDSSPQWREVLYRSASQHLALERLLPVEDYDRRDAMLATAVAELTTLVEIQQDTGSTVERASALYQLGRALKHAADFLKERERDPEKRDAFYERALTAFESSFEIDSSRVDSIGEIVLIDMALGRPQAALRAVQSRIGADLDRTARSKLYSMLGTLHLRAGRQQPALEAFDAVLKLGAGPVDTYLGQYQIYLARGDLESARRALDTAVAVQPSFVLGYIKLGELSASGQDYERAIELFERVLAVPPREALVLGMIPSRNVYRNTLYYRASAWLAWLYLEQSGEPERALDAVATARRFGSLDASLADTMGWAYFRLGDYERARTVLEQAAGTTGDLPAIHYHLAETYAALGRTEDARAAAEEALALDQPFQGRDAAQALLRQLAQ